MLEIIWVRRINNCNNNFNFANTPNNNIRASRTVKSKFLAYSKGVRSIWKKFGMFGEEITHLLLWTISNPYIGPRVRLNLRLIITNLQMTTPLTVQTWLRFSIHSTALVLKRPTLQSGQDLMAPTPWRTAIMNTQVLPSTTVNIFQKIMKCQTLIVKAIKI